MTKFQSEKRMKHNSIVFIGKSLMPHSIDFVTISNKRMLFRVIFLCKGALNCHKLQEGHCPDVMHDGLEFLEDINV